MADYGVNVGKIVFVGLLSVILTVDAVVGLQALYYRQLGQVETSDAMYPPDAELDSQRAAQQKRLTDYWVVDPKKDVVAIPISRAMELVAAELHGQDLQD